MEIKVKITAGEAVCLVRTAWIVSRNWARFGSQAGATCAVEDTEAASDPAVSDLPPIKYVVRPKTLARGIELAFTKAPGVVQQLTNGVENLDADRADVVLQLAIFGEVKYS